MVICFEKHFMHNSPCRQVAAEKTCLPEKSHPAGKITTALAASKAKGA
jgi:hypothetical protein